MAFKLDPLPFFDARSEGLTLLGNVQDAKHTNSKVVPWRVSRLVRTPDGEGLGVLRQDGTVEVWQTGAKGRMITFRAEVTGNGEDISQMLPVREEEFEQGVGPRRSFEASHFDASRSGWFLQTSDSGLLSRISSRIIRAARSTPSSFT